MNIIYEGPIYQCQSIVLPPQKRTLKFKNQLKLVEIPKSIVVAYYYYKERYITGGYICDFELNYYINFGNDFCPKGQTFDNIHDYISWYWNSGFKDKCGNHTLIDHNALMACRGNYHPFYLSFYSFVKFYQPNKLELWKSKNQEHLRCCDNCRNKLI